MKFQRTLLAVALSATLPSAWAETPKSEPAIENITVMGVRERLYEMLFRKPK